MSTTLQSLIDDLRLDFGQPLGDATARRAIFQALAFVNADLDTNYQVSGSQPNEVVEPDLVGIYRELTLLRAQAYVTRITRTVNASSISLKSADKSVSKTATGWKDLERDLLAEYWRRIKDLNPDKAEGVMVVNDDAAIYKQGYEIEKLDEPVDIFNKNK